MSSNSISLAPSAGKGTTMTEAGKKIIQEKLLEAVAVLKKRDIEKGAGGMKQHFLKAAAMYRKLGKSCAAVADAHSELARGAESRADFSSAKCHKSIADGHAVMAQAHSAHAEQCLTLANAGPDVWGLAATTIDAQGRPINDTGKMGKGAADDFFSKFVYGEPVDCSGGLFGSGPAKLAKTDQSPSGGLFE